MRKSHSTEAELGTTPTFTKDPAHFRDLIDTLQHRIVNALHYRALHYQALKELNKAQERLSHATH